MPLVLGGVWLRSVCRVRSADSLPITTPRHPRVVAQLIEAFNGDHRTRFLRANEEARRDLTGVMGFEPPSLQAAAAGARPELREPDEFEPGTTRQGWQREASSRVEHSFEKGPSTEFPNMCRGLIRPQAGTRVEAAFPKSLWWWVDCRFGEEPNLQWTPR